MRLSAIVFLLFTVLVFLIPITAIRYYSPGEDLPTHTPNSSVSSSSSPPTSSESIAIRDGDYEPPSDEIILIPGDGVTTERVQPGELVLEIPDITTLKILNTATGLVEEVSIQDYIRGAVAAEMPASFHLEAMKAQAVCAHTYALRHYMDQQKNPDPALKGAYFSADPDNLKGWATEASMREFYGAAADTHWGKICEAADSVLDVVMVHDDGVPILAAYHSASAGVTEDAANVWLASVPYLVPVDSEGDLLSPGLESTVTYTSEQMAQRLRANFDGLTLGDDPSQWLTVVERSESGYVTLMDVGNLSLHGRDVRTALGLRSTCFTMNYSGGVFTFQVTGYGHGVGLSQYGADYLARQGYTYDEILEHYYTGITLVEKE